jgi:Leucine-rich repeat (LRR) protein
LTKLQILCLFNNSLSGSIPSEVGNLKDLLEIDLSQNHLSGPIPIELGKLAQLQVLYLAFNKLSGQNSNCTWKSKVAILAQFEQEPFDRRDSSESSQLYKLNCT